jgi:hypothetical protein
MGDPAEHHPGGREGNLPGHLAGSVVEPLLFFTVPVPVPTRGKVFMRGEWETLQNIIREGEGGNLPGCPAGSVVEPQRFFTVFGSGSY